MSNCLVFALGRWVRHGGYLVVRKSRNGWWPHFIWSLDLIEFMDFAPHEPQRYKCPPLLFRGRIRSQTEKP